MKRRLKTRRRSTPRRTSQQSEQSRHSTVQQVITVPEERQPQHNQPTSAPVPFEQYTGTESDAGQITSTLEPLDDATAFARLDDDGGAE